MNIAYFLTPKNDVVFIKSASTMRQAIEKMEYHKYSAMPIVGPKGDYVGTLTEGDLLSKFISVPDLDFKGTKKVKVSEIDLKSQYKPVTIHCDIEDLILTAEDQWFVPVLDDEKRFIGIIKRNTILNYHENQIINSLKNA